MSTKTEGVNLLPRLTKAELVGEKRKNSLTLGTAGVTLIVAIVSIALLAYNQYQRFSVEGTDLPIAAMQGLDGEIAGLNTEIDKYESVISLQTELATKVNFIKDISANRPDYQQTLDRLQDLLPDEISIRSYEIMEDYTIKLSGFAKDYYSIALFINRARKQDLTAGYFDNFTIEGANKRDDKVSFSITALAVFPVNELAN